MTHGKTGPACIKLWIALNCQFIRQLVLTPAQANWKGSRRCFHRSHRECFFTKACIIISRNLFKSLATIWSLYDKLSVHHIIFVYIIWYSSVASCINWGTKVFRFSIWRKAFYLMIPNKMWHIQKRGSSKLCASRPGFCDIGLFITFQSKKTHYKKQISSDKS